MITVYFLFEFQLLDLENNKLVPPPIQTELDDKPIRRAKAVFKQSGQITSREQRARAISHKNEEVNVKKKSRLEQRAYAINYTKQDEHLKSKNLKKLGKSGWSPKRFKKYPRFTIFLSNCKYKVINVYSV